MFLQAFFVSDRVDGSGLHITDDAWQGRRQGTLFKNESWPKQGNPTRADGLVWRKNIRTYIMGRGLRLKTTLGPWKNFDPNWTWYYTPSDGRLYNLSDQG